MRSTRECIWCLFQLKMFHFGFAFIVRLEQINEHQYSSMAHHTAARTDGQPRRAKELMSSIFVRVVILCWRLALSVSLRKIVCGMKNRSADNRRFTEKNKTKTEKYNAENEEEQKKKRHQNDSQRKLRSKTKPKSSYCFSVYYKLNIIIEMKKKTGDSKHFISVWNQWEPLEPAFRHSLWKKNIRFVCANVRRQLIYAV